jgi:hypothetical protein
MTPGEVNLRAFCFYREQARAEKSAWRRDAHFTALLLNASGKTMKRTVKARDLARFAYEDSPSDGKGDKPKVTGEERRRQMLETLKFQKTKFWGVIPDKALADFEASVVSGGK